MKSFFEEYLAIPLSVLLFISIVPTVLLGGFKLAEHIFSSPNPASCEVEK